MSLEQAIQDLTITVAANVAATQKLIEIMVNAKVDVGTPTATATVAQAFPAAPVAALAPAAPIAVAAGMPLAPFPTPGAAPAAMPAFMQQQAPAAALPFSDVPTLIKYAGTVYMALEQKAPGSGNRINEVLAACGLSNMNDATPAHFPNIYAGLESLKAA